MNGGKPIVIGTSKEVGAPASFWETRKYASYGGCSVSLRFKPPGAASYTTVKKVPANGSGALKTTLKASKTPTTTV
ncbi:hypothetical protein [Streptomyces sp. NPDC017556]|uniref:hypothetical protein n=1 Tax=Streptomyces sp. NPDC017556 TaxID=3365002 RepID=UPI0037BBC7BB